MYRFLLLSFLAVLGEGGALAADCDRHNGPVKVANASFKDVPIQITGKGIRFQRHEKKTPRDNGTMVEYEARCVKAKAPPGAQQKTTSCETWCIQPVANWEAVRGDAIGLKDDKAIPAVCHYDFENKKAFDISRDGKTVGRIKVDETGNLNVLSVEAVGNDFPVKYQAPLLRIEQKIELVAAKPGAKTSERYGLKTEAFHYATGDEARGGKSPLGLHYDHSYPETIETDPRNQTKPKPTSVAYDDAEELRKGYACTTGACRGKNHGCPDIDTYMRARREAMGIKENGSSVWYTDGRTVPGTVPAATRDRNIWSGGP